MNETTFYWPVSATNAVWLTVPWPMTLEQYNVLTKYLSVIQRAMFGEKPDAATPQQR